MTDEDLARALLEANRIERAARQYRDRATSATENGAAHGAVRGAVALRKALESWIAARAVRATATQ